MKKIVKIILVVSVFFIVSAYHYVAAASSAPCADGSTLQCSSEIIEGTTVNTIAVEGDAGGKEQHCAVRINKPSLLPDERILPYDNAVTQHYEDTDIDSSDATVANGVAPPSSCQMSCAEYKAETGWTGSCVTKNNPVLRAHEVAHDRWMYGWYGHSSGLSYAGETRAGCDPLPVGICAMAGTENDSLPLYKEDEKYYITMLWVTHGSSNTFARSHNVFVKNERSGLCAIATPLESGPVAAAGDAGFSPELDKALEHQDDDTFTFAWLADSSKDTPPGPVPCSGASTVGAPTITSGDTAQVIEGNDVTLNIKGALLDDELGLT